MAKGGQNPREDRVSSARVRCKGFTGRACGLFDLAASATAGALGGDADRIQPAETLLIWLLDQLVMIDEFGNTTRVSR